MPTAAVLGRLAYIRASTAAASTATTSQTKIAELRNYTLTVEGDVIPIESHDTTGWRESLQHFRRWNWEAEVIYLSTGAAQGALRGEFSTANPGLVNITFGQTSALNAKKWQGKTRLTGFTVNHDTNDAVLGTLRGEGNGSLTRVA